MRALMATDGSKHATAALLSACRILSSNDRNVDLMCVAPTHKHHRHLESLRRRVARTLKAAQDALCAEDVNARTRLETGSPARLLIRASASYDLTVIGAESHRNGMAGLGPVASRVVEHSNTSILIGREMRSDAGTKILAAVDGSDGSLRALEKMASLVDLSSAEVTLIHVVETPWLYGEDQEELEQGEETKENLDLQAQLEREFECEGEQILEEARARLPGWTAVDTMIQRGLPAEEILSEVDRGDYDLVVVAASGATDLKHQILGSVSTQVAWNARCSVLLVRSPD